MIAHASRRRSPPRQFGFTLMSVLIAIFLFGFGLLAILRSLGSTTGAATQNQNVGIVSSLSNGFWGAVQANPAMLADPALGGGTPVTFTAGNVGSAPAGLQPWLYSLTDTTVPTSGLPPSGLPGGSATIQVLPDADPTSPCPALFKAGCFGAKLTIAWTQVASDGTPASTRSQDFFYQFGL